MRRAQTPANPFPRFPVGTMKPGDSIERPEMVKLFQSTLGDINRKEISWNGYEKNVLFVNQEARAERFTNGSFLFGTAYAFDGRSVVADEAHDLSGVEIDGHVIDGFDPAKGNRYAPHFNQRWHTGTAPGTRGGFLRILSLHHFAPSRLR